MNLWEILEAQKTAISVLQLIENGASFRLCWVSSRLGMNFLVNSRSAENGSVLELIFEARTFGTAGTMKLPATVYC